MVQADARWEPESFRQFQQTLKKIAPETRKALNKQFKELLKPMQATAQANASWSRRIPKAIKPSATTRRVALIADHKKAPHARPFEGYSGSTFKHPLFGNKERWFSQQARPFMQQAQRQHATDFIDAARVAMDEAARKAGFSERA